MMKSSMMIVGIALHAWAAAASPGAADDVFISAAEAKALLGKGDVRFVFSDADKEFDKEHIAGSVIAYSHDLHYLDDVKACRGLPMCEQRAAAFIGGTLGVDASTPVIVYDNGVGANASGSWFFLKLYGHPNTRILDGGLAAWKAAGGAVEAGKANAAASPKTFTPKADTSMIVTREDVQRATADGAHFLIVDARHNLDEYTGKSLLPALSSPGKEQTVARGGFIPGAVFSPWKKYAGNPNGEAGKTTLKDAAELRKQLEKLRKNGYDEKKTVISYCHVGLGRGSFQYLALKKAGHADVKLYVGSWNEWGNDAALPVGQAQ